MKLLLSILTCVACLAFAVSGCGSDNATSSQTQETSPATTADSGGEADDGGDADAGESADGEAEGDGESDAQAADEAEAEPVSKLVIGTYEGEGAFSAVSGNKGNEKPTFKPTGEPAPKEITTRDLKVGTGPAAKRGDQVFVYYAGALLESGKVTLYGWLPGKPATFALGESVFGKSWEKTIEGMKVGGLRQVIIPESEWAQQKPVDYVIALMDLQPKSGG